jgi:hypothetical protein
MMVSTGKTKTVPQVVPSARRSLQRYRKATYQAKTFRMIGGFALVAAPAEYRVTGVKTFMASYDGVVYQKDVGPDTLKVFSMYEVV